MRSLLKIRLMALAILRARKGGPVRLSGEVDDFAPHGVRLAGCRYAPIYPGRKVTLMTSENPQPEIYASTPLLLRHLQAAGAQTNRQLEIALGDVDQIGSEQIEDWIRWAIDNGIIEPTGGTRYNITARGQGIIGPPNYTS